MKRLLLALLAAALVLGSEAAAKKSTAKGRKTKPAAAAQPASKPSAQPVESKHRRLPYVGAASYDLKTGTVLFSDHADEEAYPASVSKLMTLLLVIEDVRAGRYSFDTEVSATADVYRSEPSWFGLKVGDRITVRDLAVGLMVESANDAAIALAVNSAGSFDAFVAKMNSRARALGMTRTVYYNPNGLPPNPGKRYPWKNFNVSTASDQLKLAVKLIEYPETVRFTSVKTADLIRTSGGYRVAVTRRVGEANSPSTLADGEKVVRQLVNHNNVMVKDKLKIRNPDGSEAVDGLKTGYIDAGGSSVVITAQRKGRRVVAVVLGSMTSKDRDAAARRLIEDALDAMSWK